MTIDSHTYRYDRSVVWMAALAELPGLTALMLLKSVSLALALPLHILSTCHQRFIARLCRYLAFPVF